VNKRTHLNWIIDAALFISGLLVLLTGIYFLLIPSGGYQGGRNPMYGVIILFERHTWRDVHQWSGLAMIALSAIHVVLHWEWFKAMTKCTAKAVLGKRALSPKAWANLIVIVLIGLSFLLAAVSGLPFLSLSGENLHTGTNMRLQTNQAALSATTTFDVLTNWEAIHTWASIAMIVFAVIHLIIHWPWVTRMTARLFGLTLHRQTAAGTLSRAERAGAGSCQASHVIAEAD
jgi:hypothetical protein